MLSDDERDARVDMPNFHISSLDVALRNMWQTDAKCVLVRVTTKQFSRISFLFLHNHRVCFDENVENVS